MTDKIRFSIKLKSADFWLEISKNQRGCSLRGRANVVELDTAACNNEDIATDEERQTGPNSNGANTA